MVLSSSPTGSELLVSFIAIGFTGLPLTGTESGAASFPTSLMVSSVVSVASDTSGFPASVVVSWELWRHDINYIKVNLITSQ